MEIPDLVRQRLGDEEIESAVNLGDENLICFTPSRTLLYRSEGLISDDSIEVFGHDVERLDVSTGRRKTKFTLEYVDGTRKFSVAKDRTEPLLERLLAGVLRTAGVIDSDEDVAGVYRFSEMTVLVTDRRLVKHVGAFVWDEDYEEYPYADVTGLSFEEGSVATQIVLSVAGRPQRLKAPNDQAPIIRQTLTQVLFDYHDVASLDQLNDRLNESASGSDEASQSDVSNASSSLALDDSITPLVGSSSDTEPSQPQDSHGDEDTRSDTPGKAAVGDSAIDSSLDSAAENVEGNRRTGDDSGAQSDVGPGVDPEEFDALKERVATLTTAVQRQNELLKQQHETIDQLVTELRNQ